jgi:hypothetical protein
MLVIPTARQLSAKGSGFFGSLDETKWSLLTASFAIQRPSGTTLGDKHHKIKPKVGSDIF